MMSIYVSYVCIHVVRGYTSVCYFCIMIWDTSSELVYELLLFVYIVLRYGRFHLTRVDIYVSCVRIHFVDLEYVWWLFSYR